jgi:hypothetical protein
MLGVDVEWRLMFSSPSSVRNQRDEWIWRKKFVGGGIESSMMSCILYWFASEPLPNYPVLLVFAAVSSSSHRRTHIIQLSSLISLAQTERWSNKSFWTQEEQRNKPSPTAARQYGYLRIKLQQWAIFNSTQLVPPLPPIHDESSDRVSSSFPHYHSTTIFIKTYQITNCWIKARSLG